MNTRTNTKLCQKVRYRVQFTGDDGGVGEICTSTSLVTAIAKARRHTRYAGHKAWVWNAATGETVYRTYPMVQVAAGGGR